MSRIDELTDRIERLLLRHEELRRTNDLLAQQVTVITQERDSLRARLAAARGRIDALLDKLPLPATGVHPGMDADVDADDMDAADHGHPQNPDA
ncbi:cell division protein ZapB [Aquabacterium sp.]|jgi:cell division protein ZapB|uniref:cell division protein ZapB n=1 Tax=Aquabacterium sp. TaxID=1872578 RepID=UPI00248A3DA3|nr:cell division protein ZapB [Aquabacterium sp.]MDI1349797.1 cell division protein ZapB [Aquabacterium sp.]